MQGCYYISDGAAGLSAATPIHQSIYFMCHNVSQLDFSISWYGKCAQIIIYPGEHFGIVGLESYLMGLEEMAKVAIKIDKPTAMTIDYGDRQFCQKYLSCTYCWVLLKWSHMFNLDGIF